MMIARPPKPAGLPLLVWSELAEVDRLQAQRTELARRIKLLGPHCHKRIELEVRLRAITARQLELLATIGTAQ